MHRQLKGLGITACLVSGMIASCGYDHQGQSELNRVEAIEGSLYVVPEGDVTGGQVKYLIYKNGMITYMGDVSYNLNLGDLINQEIQPTFRGQYKADPETVNSATYMTPGKSHRDFKAAFLVTKVDKSANVAEVNAIAAAESAIGRITVDLSESTIRIKSATVTGDTQLGRRTIRLTDQKPPLRTSE